MQLIQDAKKAYEQRLIAAFPTIKIAFENVKFDPPSSLYLAVNSLIDNPTDVVLGDDYFRENIILNVFVVGEANTGTGAILTKAEEVRELFKKGTFILQGTSRIYVLTTPHIMGTTETSSRPVCPVQIRITVEAG